jgi:hypothetical protein
MDLGDGGGGDGSENSRKLVHGSSSSRTRRGQVVGKGAGGPADPSWRATLSHHVGRVDRTWPNLM